MSFDKEKTRRTAEKNLSQGKIQAAIRDYCQIVEHDGKDFNTLNMLGDLYVRVEARSEAIVCFERIAQHYNSQGFAHKAIAMYKKILRLMPNSSDISAKIAPLYQTLGLVAEARSYYLTVAEAHQRSGNQLQALEIWSRIADLDPNDTNTRIKLAQNYLAEGEREKAAEALVEAGNRLLAKKQSEQAAQIFAQALDLRPTDINALSGATNASIALGFPDEAAERLEKARELYPESSELLSLLAHAYVAADNAEAAETTVFKLVEREPMSFKRHLDVVALYLKENKVADAARILGFCGEVLLSNNQEVDLLQWVDEVLARDPEQLVALRVLTRIRAWQRNEDELRKALERLAESAQMNQAPDEERNALVELATLFPEDESYLIRLRELGADTPENLAAASEGFQATTDQYVPQFESFDRYNEDQHNNNGYSNGNGHHVVENFEENGWQASNNNLDAQFLGDNVDYHANGNGNGNGFLPANSLNVTDFADVDSKDFSFNNFDLSPSENSAEKRTPAPPSLKQELESVDFYIAQGYVELATESLDLLEAQHGAQPDIQMRRQQLRNDVQTEFSAPLNDEPVNVSNQSANHQKSAVMPPEAVADPLQTTGNIGFEDLFAELGEDMDVADLSVGQTADYETHYNLGLAYKEMGLYDDAVEEFQTAVKMVMPQDGTPRYLQCCHLIGHCFMEKDMPKLAILWYQRGIDAPDHTEDEYQALRYELGTAYEKAGEVGKAADLFSEIYAVNVAYRSVGDKLRSLQQAT